MNPDALWSFLPLGYLTSVLIEGPILLIGLAPQHSLRTRLLAAFWLTACTYPIVVLVLPLLLLPEPGRWAYLLVAETFAPTAECGLFWLMYGDEISDRRALLRDMLTIVVANLASFLIGELLW